jgi:hypothetical protein
VRDKLTVLILDRIARRYGKLPHELLGLGIIEFSFDLAVAMRAIEEEKKRKEDLLREFKGKEIPCPLWFLDF